MNRKRKATDQPDQPICKYGSLCYRKNAEHRKKFHPNPPCKKKREDKSLSKEDLSIKVQDTKNLKTHTDKKNCINKKPMKSQVSETVEDVLKSMPADFFDFWDFCSTIKSSNPAEAFAEIGLHLVGVYDLLAKKMPKDKTILIHTHWRYYYDPPEFQTVIKTDDKDLYHIGYFRDDPAEFPSILAANKAKTGPKLLVKGDNIFAAVNAEINDRLDELDAKVSDKFSKIQEKLKLYAKKKKYVLLIQSTKVKTRQKKVVSPTFHGLGIVVPVKNHVGYRPLPDSDSKVRSILQRIADAKSEKERLAREELLDELITNVHFGNDEGDFGMGLELGIDLFCFGNPLFHHQCLDLLKIAYGLLKREKYIHVITAHLADRKDCKDLSTL